MGWITCTILALCMTSFSTAQFDTFVNSDPDAIADEETVNKKFDLLQSTIKMLFEEGTKAVFPFVNDIIASLNISSSCFRDCAKLLLGLRKLNTWAIKFIDATTKSVDGILNIEPSSLGSYDECVENKVLYRRPKKLKGQVMFQGKYCNVHLRTFLKRDDKATIFGSDVAVPERNDTEIDSIFHEIRTLAPLMYFASLRAGLCLPSGCSTEDANAILRLVSDYIGMSLKATTCVTKEEKQYTPIMIAVMTIYSLTGLLVLIGTVVHIYSYYFRKDYKSAGIQILRAFSFISNFKKLIGTPSSTNTSCLNGMRFLSMSWIILSHTYMYHLLIHHSVKRNMLDYGKDLAFQAVENGYFAVDTFFFISGFLTCYLTTKRIKGEKKPFSLKFYVLHRIWRIMPAYAFVIGYEFLKPLTGSGPLFHEVYLYDQKICKNNWWTNFLFINNFYRNQNICVPQSWYIAVDMQLYILALFILVPLMKWPKIGVFIAGLAIAAGMAVSGITSYMDGIVGIYTNSGGVKELNTWHHNHNMNLHLHSVPFVIGLLLGYLLATRFDFKVPKVLQLLGWCVSAAMCLAVVYGTQKWNAGLRPTDMEIIIYSSFSRFAWGLGIAWMTFCCCTGNGGVINYILSWNVWTPLSRLSYFAYLVHVTVMLAYNGNLRSILPFQHFIIVWIFLADLLIIYAVSFVGYVLVESPFASLEKILFLGEKKEVFSLRSIDHVRPNDLKKNHQNEGKNYKNMYNSQL